MIVFNRCKEFCCYVDNDLLIQYFLKIFTDVFKVRTYERYADLITKVMILLLMESNEIIDDDLNYINTLRRVFSLNDIELYIDKVKISSFEVEKEKHIIQIKNFLKIVSEENCYKIFHLIWNFVWYNNEIDFIKDTLEFEVSEIFFNQIDFEFRQIEMKYDLLCYLNKLTDNSKFTYNFKINIIVDKLNIITSNINKNINNYEVYVLDEIKEMILNQILFFLSYTKMNEFKYEIYLKVSEILGLKTLSYERIENSPFDYGRYEVLLEFYEFTKIMNDTFKYNHVINIICIFIVLGNNTTMYKTLRIFLMNLLNINEIEKLIDVFDN